jgi:phospholipase/lecithinase/hemolysin
LQSVLPLWKELDYFKEYAAKLRSFQGDDRAQETLSEALYVVSMGTNDFLENYYAVPSGHAAQYAAASGYAGYLLGVAESFARALHALGARKLDLNGLPPMGCLPLERHAATGACTEEYNAVARAFNAGLRDLVARLDGDGGARVVYGDVYGPVADVLADPAAYGFEDVAAGCCGTTGRFEMGYMCNEASPLTCADAGNYAFWDAIHPTEHLHRFLADRKMNTSLYVFQ